MEEKKMFYFSRIQLSEGYNKYSVPPSPICFWSNCDKWYWNLTRAAVAFRPKGILLPFSASLPRSHAAEMGNQIWRCAAQNFRACFSDLLLCHFPSSVWGKFPRELFFFGGETVIAEGVKFYFMAADGALGKKLWSWVVCTVLRWTQMPILHAEGQPSEKTIGCRMWASLNKAKEKS